MADNTQKRELKLETLDDIVAEANRLLAAGYTSHGKWNLAQACFHISEWARFPMDGYPKPPWFMRMIFGALGAFGVIERMKNGILQNGFKAGTPTAPQTVVGPNAMNDQEGVAKLTETIERMKSFEGPIHPSPLFGEMDHDTFTKVTLLHAEHHLAFLH